jgi:hypothetical protein
MGRMSVNPHEIKREQSVMMEHYPPTMKILCTPLSRRRERVGVRVVIIKPSPLTVSLGDTSRLLWFIYSGVGLHPLP